MTDFFGDAGALHSPDALLTPFGYGHGFDEFKLGVGLRKVLGDDAGEHGVETVLVFSFHDDGLREETVAFGVAGDDLFALGGYGPCDFLPLAWEALIRFSELIGLLRLEYGMGLYSGLPVIVQLLPGVVAQQVVEFGVESGVGFRLAAGSIEWSQELRSRYFLPSIPIRRRHLSRPATEAEAD